jgi:tryptophanyl-tRNA synthetase
MVLHNQRTAISGITASALTLSLGNLLGAIRPWLKFQSTHKTYYFVADLHAITVRQPPETFAQQVLNVSAWYIAAGLDPQKSTLFVQSHVPEHAELAWLLQTFTQMGELERMTQFKDKSARHTENINAGLFTYPSLMAADILLYHAHDVPVGEDQTQHLELTRDIATRFNNAYGATFTVPKVVLPQAAARVKDLQHPEKKMSKSDPGLGTILLTDTPDDIRKKISKAVTDTRGVIEYDEANQPGLANLLGIYAALTENATPKSIAEKYAGQQYGPFKKALADKLVAELEPLQKRYAALVSDKAELLNILKKGAAQAQAVAGQTLHDVKNKMGFLAG